MTKHPFSLSQGREMLCHRSMFNCHLSFRRTFPHQSELPRRQVPQQRRGFSRRQSIHFDRTGAALFEIQGKLAAKDVNDGRAQQRLMTHKQRSAPMMMRKRIE